MLERIVYVSRAAPGTGREAVYGIIREAHAWNARIGLTGGLVFLDGWFVQVIEGRREQLNDRLARIWRDPRHGGIQLRQRGPVLRRAFADQCMALRTRACLDPALLETFGYRSGFPVDVFPVDNLLEFVIRACRQTAGRGTAIGGQA